MSEGRKPRRKTGEKPASRRPFAIDALPQSVRDEILKRRAKGETWHEISDASPEFAGRPLALSVLHRWYDVRVEQVQRELLAQSESARQLASAFAERGLENLPEATLSALSAETFTALSSSTQKDRLKGLSNLLSRISELIDAQAKAKRADVSLGTLELERKKLELAKQKVLGLKGEVGKKKMSAEELSKKLDEIYDIAS